MAASLNNVLQKMDPDADTPLLDEILRGKEPKDVKVIFIKIGFQYFVLLPVF